MRSTEGDIRGRLDRSTVTVRPDAAWGAISRRARKEGRRCRHLLHDSRHPFRRAIPDGVQRVVLQMGIALGGSGLTMAKYLADEVEAVAAGYGDRGEAVPKVMNADIVEPGRPRGRVATASGCRRNVRCRARLAERMGCLPGAATRPAREGRVRRAARFWLRCCCRAFSGTREDQKSGDGQCGSLPWPAPARPPSRARPPAESNSSRLRSPKFYMIADLCHDRV